ncbi:metallophosphoesterase family protein [Heyndrickxia sp. NPDC080065]|uniref:metallophosphoesterase family protein n=1 Tax=Heyndrickxia sp. NPDC080065 TaxID=3390568 RepID=UPI003D01968A
MITITNTTRILAISDIHGCLNEFKELLAKVKFVPNNDQLILLGDYMDRGKYSKEVIYFVKELVEEQGAIALKGNHDQLFCDWLNDPIEKQNSYFRIGGLETIKSFLEDIDNDNVNEKTYQEWANKIQESHNEIIGFIENLPYFYETNDFIFIHAGINPEHEDWKLTTEHEMVWIRGPFLDVDHSFDHTFIHGHTPAIYLHENPDIYYGNKKIGIDGACVYGHQLNCLEILNDEFKQYSVKGETVYEDE